MVDEQEVTPTPEEGEDKTKENEVVEQVDDKDLKSALAQKEHFRVKTEKLEAEKAELLAKVEVAQQKEEKPTQNITEQSNKDVDSLKERLAKIEFSQQNPDIDAGDVEQIFELAGLNSKSPKEILEENDMVKVYLEKKTKDKQVANAIPEGNRSGGIPREKPVSEMTREEHMEWAKQVMD
jgi:hypothetical protein